MKKFSFVYLLTALISIYFFLTSHSRGEATIGNEGATNAPGEPYCSQCHSGGVYAPVSVSIQIFSHGTTNAITAYKPDTLYDMKVTVTAGAGTPAGYGFQMTCLTSGANSPLAGYSNLESSVTMKLLTATGRTYIEQNATSVSNKFTFSWTAPAAGMGTVVFYAAGNAVNGNGASTGDNPFYTSLSLPQASPPLVISGVTTNVLCYGVSTGAINITVTGGTAPYSYNWGSGITSQNRTALAAGNYTITVTDNASATATSAFTITQPASALDVSGTSHNVSCFGGNSGSINITANGGTAGYTYNWGGGITSQNRSSLTVGNYSVTVTDANSCIASASFSVTQPANALSVSGTTGNVSCFGGNNGSINITASGGTAGYTYNWGNSITSQNRSSLTTGNYSVTVTDANSCIASASFSITQPANALSVSGITGNVSCFGGNNGSINITASGGTAGYTYNWGGGITSQNRNTLVAGNYSLTVSDTNHCTASASFNISQPPVLYITDTANLISCYGGSSSVIIGATGGTLPYTGTGNFEVQAGLHIYLINDANGCTDSASINISQPTQLIASAGNVTIPCTGGSGTITVSAAGGTEPYTGTGNFMVNTPGTYNYTVSDANACTATATGTAFAATGLSDTANVTGISCNGVCDGNVFVSVSGGTPPYSYAWNDSINSQNATNLCAGNYVQTITDSTGCSIVNNYVVPDVAALQINITKDSIYCFGDSANIFADASGGTPSYNYQWNTGQTQSSIKAPAGNYSLSVSDNHNCADSAVVVFLQPAQLSITGSVNNVFCFGNNTGAVNITVTGGATPYNYNWGYDITTKDVDSLPAGNYAVNVTDNNACTATDTFTIMQPAQTLNISDTTINVLCFGENNGAINISATGGTSPYTYNWGYGITSQNRSALPAGDYSVVVSDSNSCSDSASSMVTQPDSMHLTLVSVVNDTGNSTGAINISVNGGTGPYTFAWSNSDTTQDISHLGDGIYAVTVTDSNGCIKSIENISIIATGIEDITAETIKIYPNPVSDKIFLSLPPLSNGQFNIRMLSLQGAVVKTATLNGGLQYLDVSNLSGAFYLLEINSENVRVRYRILKLE